MDKRKVIQAYRRGFINLHECAQILGIDSMQVMGMMKDAALDKVRIVGGKQPVG